MEPAEEPLQDVLVTLLRHRPGRRPTPEQEVEVAGVTAQGRVGCVLAIQWVDLPHDMPVVRQLDDEGVVSRFDQHLTRGAVARRLVRQYAGMAGEPGEHLVHTVRSQHRI